LPERFRGQSPVIYEVRRHFGSIKLCPMALDLADHHVTFREAPDLSNRTVRHRTEKDEISQGGILRDHWCVRRLKVTGDQVGAVASRDALA
jgi:hypothetical protein